MTMNDPHCALNNIHHIISHPQLHPCPHFEQSRVHISYCGSASRHHVVIPSDFCLMCPACTDPFQRRTAASMRAYVCVSAYVSPYVQLSGMKLENANALNMNTSSHVLYRRTSRLAFASLPHTHVQTRRNQWDWTSGKKKKPNDRRSNKLLSMQIKRCRWRQALSVSASFSFLPILHVLYRTENQILPHRHQRSVLTPICKNIFILNLPLTEYNINKLFKKERFLCGTNLLHVKHLLSECRIIAVKHEKGKMSNRQFNVHLETYYNCLYSWMFSIDIL